jgi:hypothetical protein
MDCVRNTWITEAIQEELLREGVNNDKQPRAGESNGVFYEFFAGGGMARAALGPRGPACSPMISTTKKAASYAANWGADHLKVGDVAKVKPTDLPGTADLAWASFPYQDLFRMFDLNHGNYRSISASGSPAARALMYPRLQLVPMPLQTAANEGYCYGLLNRSYERPNCPFALDHVFDI